MSETDSSYSFPIFISSTIYDFVDLRAELGRYLIELGYKPFLSDADGFHDSGPDMQPWESCLQVLSTSFIMILIIDGRYGKKFKWNYHKDIFGDREVSPTHAEYLYAHKKGIRLLVFVREQVFHLYQNYVTALKNSANEVEFEKSKEGLKTYLPSNISVESLEFLHEIKNTSPIPWVKPFKSVVEIKAEVQKKMLNELAELFLIKNRYSEMVTIAFSKVLEELESDKRTEILKSIGFTNSLIEQIDSQSQTIKQLKGKETELNNEIKKIATERDSADKNKKAEIARLTSQIKTLSSELSSTKKLISTNELATAGTILTNGPLATDTSTFTTSSFLRDLTSFSTTNQALMTATEDVPLDFWTRLGILSDTKTGTKTATDIARELSTYTPAATKSALDIARELSTPSAYGTKSALDLARELSTPSAYGTKSALDLAHELSTPSTYGTKSALNLARELSVPSTAKTKTGAEFTSDRAKSFTSKPNSAKAPSTSAKAASKTKSKSAAAGSNASAVQQNAKTKVSYKSVQKNASKKGTNKTSKK